jgi:hypothetical protein
MKQFAWNLADVAFCFVVGIGLGYWIFGPEHIWAGVNGALIGSILAR